jgi:hypothetical protein
MHGGGSILSEAAYLVWAVFQCVRYLCQIHLLLAEIRDFVSCCYT